MARGRMLNRSVSVSFKFQSLPDDTCRLFATWTIPYLDKRGVFYGDPTFVRSMVMPQRADITNEVAAQYMDAIESVGLIVRFKAEGRTWQYWPGFTDNQVGLRDDREGTDFPPPPACEVPTEVQREYDDNPEPIRNQSGKNPESSQRKSAPLQPEVEGEGEVEVESNTTHTTPEIPENLRNQSRPPTKKQKAQRDFELQTHPAILAWRNVFPDNHLERLQVSAIIRDVDDVAKWGELCIKWGLRKNNPENIDDLLDVYKNGWRWEKGSNGKSDPGKKSRRDMTPAERINEGMQ